MSRSERRFEWLARPRALQKQVGQKQAFLGKVDPAGFSTCRVPETSNFQIIHFILVCQNINESMPVQKSKEIKIARPYRVERERVER